MYVSYFSQQVIKIILFVCFLSKYLHFLLAMKFIVFQNAQKEPGAYSGGAGGFFPLLALQGSPPPAGSESYTGGGGRKHTQGALIILRFTHIAKFLPTPTVILNTPLEIDFNKLIQKSKVYFVDYLDIVLFYYCPSCVNSVNFGVT